jgi:hypothetical protein
MGVKADNLPIVNMALNRLGAESITSYPETVTRNGKIITGPVYAQTVKEVLRMNPWACAIARNSVNSAARSSPPAGDFTQEATIPTGCIRILDIGGDKEIPFRVEGTKILHNVAGATIVVRLINFFAASDGATDPDPTTWDPILTEAVVARLASKTCHIITGKFDVAQALYQEYLIALAAAKAVAVIESKEDVADILGFWNDVRYAMAQPRNKVSE